MNLLKLLSTGLLCISVYAQTVVQNDTLKPSYGLNLTEELRFGGQGDEDHLIWPDLNTRVFPGPEGVMYVFDTAAKRALLFDERGVFQKQVAGPGNGPGELQMPLSISQSADGSFVVLDGPFIDRFDAHMNFIDQIPTRDLGVMPMTVEVSPDGRYLAGIFSRIDPKTRSMFVRTGVVSLEEKQFLQKFHEFQSPLPDRTRMQDPAMWEDFLAKQFQTLYQNGVITYGGDGRIYAGASNEYEVKAWKPGEQKAQLVMKASFKPLPFGDAEKAHTIDHFWNNMPPGARQLISKNIMERAMKKADLPPGKAPLMALLPVEDKGVIALRDLDLASRATTGDVFDTQGKYLCTLEVADNGLAAYSASKLSVRMVFHKNKAYTIHTDEDGTNAVVRYRYSLKKL